MTDPPRHQRPTWLQPVWMVGHLVAATGIVLFVLLGFWQFGRHQDRAALDDVVERRRAMPVVDFASIAEEPIDEIEYRLVAVTGIYDATEEVIWRARTLNGVSGHHVITPLILDDDRRLLIDRGWVPIDLPDPGAAAAAPPAGQVEVVGLVRRPQPASGFGPADPATGELDRISRLIPARLAPQISGELIVELYIQRRAPESGVAETTLPLPGAAPEPGGGPPHLSYAVQWWVFAAVVAIGYPILLVRTERKRRVSGRPARRDRTTSDT